MEHYDVIIVGGGAAGLFARANLPPCNALLLEAGEEAGRKLLITGSGMCNLTNTLDVQEFLNHYGSKGQRNFLLPALQNLTPTQLRDWFEGRGIATIARSDGKVFPQGGSARQVRDGLLASSNIPIRYHEKVSAIAVASHGFLVATASARYHTKTLIVATGGKSYPRTGSDGSLYPILRGLGHTVVQPKPALVGLVIHDWHYSALTGSSLQNVSVSAVHGGERKPYYQGSGDLLFTHRGLSGPPILTLSGSALNGDTITVTFVAEPMRTLEVLARTHPQQQMATHLREAGLTRAFAAVVLEQANIEAGATWNHIDGSRRNGLCSLLGAHPFVVEGTMGFSSAMATRGGVALGGVNRKSMESRLHDGLFFCGEVLDYDGESGGFNLQGAFSTALLAASHVQERVS
jgi:predicted Rossmann fold flavoprotein